MAHQIETHKDKAAFVTANVPAWHQLGTVFGGVDCPAWDEEDE